VDLHASALGQLAAFGHPADLTLRTPTVSGPDKHPRERDRSDLTRDARRRIHLDGQRRPEGFVCAAALEMPRGLRINVVGERDDDQSSAWPQLQGKRQPM
jgi:hypothetical protein